VESYQKTLKEDVAQTQLEKKDERVETNLETKVSVPLRSLLTG